MRLRPTLSVGSCVPQHSQVAFRGCDALSTWAKDRTVDFASPIKSLSLRITCARIPEANSLAPSTREHGPSIGMKRNHVDGITAFIFLALPFRERQLPVPHDPIPAFLKHGLIVRAEGDLDYFIMMHKSRPPLLSSAKAPQTHHSGLSHTTCAGKQPFTVSANRGGPHMPELVERCPNWFCSPDVVPLQEFDLDSDSIKTRNEDESKSTHNLTPASARGGAEGTAIRDLEHQDLALRPPRLSEHLYDMSPIRWNVAGGTLCPLPGDTGCEVPG